MGGLDFPNVKVYQLCAHLRYISEWVNNDASSIWRDIESSLSKYRLQDLLFFKNFKDIRDNCINPNSQYFEGMEISPPSGREDQINFHIYPNN